MSLKSLRVLAALGIVFFLAALFSPAQDLGPLSTISRPYRSFETAPISLTDSDRLDSLIRAGQLYLSLQDAIALALENNLDIETRRYDFRIADANFALTKAGTSPPSVSTQVQEGASSAATQALGGFTASGTDASSNASGGFSSQLDPIMSFGYGWSHTSSPQPNTVTTGTTAAAYNSSGIEYSVSKSFTTDAGVELSWTSTSTQSNIELSDFNPSNNGTLGIYISQSLLRGFGAGYRRNIRIARNNLDLTDLVFQRQVITTVTSVVQLYWDLVSYAEDVRVNREALVLAQQLLHDNEVRVKAGALAPIDVVRARAQVARRQEQVALSEGYLLQQEKILKSQLSRTGLENPLLALVRVVPTDRLQVPSTDAVQPVEDLVSLALDSHPDMLQTGIELENAEISLKASADNLRPDLSVYTRLQNSGLAGTLNPLSENSPDPYFVGGYGTLLGQVFRRNFPSYEFGFSLSIPLRNRVARENYTIASLRLRQQELDRRSQINQLRLDVENALVALEQARIRYEAAVDSRELAEQLLHAEETRFELGVTEAYFVIQYQTELASAQSTEVAALAEYVKTKVGLDSVTGQTLEVFGISVDDAREGRSNLQPSSLPPAE